MVLVVMVGFLVVAVGYWWLFWVNGGGSGGDSICIGDSGNSCKSDIVKCMLCGEDGCCDGGGGGDGGGSGGGGDGSGRREQRHHNHY